MSRLYAVQSDNQVRISVILQTGPSSAPVPLDLTQCTAVLFAADGPAHIQRPGTFVADEKGQAAVTLLASDLAAPGVYDAQWRVTFSDATVVTLPDPGYDILTVTEAKAT